MNKKPIIVIDDDNDDLDLLKEAFAQLHIENEIIVFNDGFKFIDFVRSSSNRAFFTLCDVNMGRINGLELKKLVFEDEKLRLKCVPFIFLSTSKASAEVLRAYSYGVQGYFVKPQSFPEIKTLLRFIIDYWSHSEHPDG